MRSLSPVLLLLFGSLVNGLFSQSASLPNPRLNVLFILADDLGWSDLGSYGSTFHETPHLDQLAREGARFSQAYAAASICSPTRASLMTGKYPVRTGVTDYIPGMPANNRKLVTQRTQTELALDEYTVGEAFRDGGYETVYMGKWHLGKKGFEPSDQGFDRYVPIEDFGDHQKDWQVGKRMAESAAHFLTTRRSEKPFFAWVSFHEPHTPILEYPDYIQHFRKKAASLPKVSETMRPEHEGQNRIRQDDPGYASEVAGLDSYVGIILDAIDKAGIKEETLVVFFSDNGGLSVRSSPGPTSNAPLRGGKGWLYEGGIRVPLIIRGPVVSRPGAVIDHPIISTDFYPTLLSLAGLPLKPSQHVDGVNFRPLLAGKQTLPPRIFYWHYPHYHGSTWAPGSALREDNWKLVVQDHYKTVELYDLAADPGETTDLSRQETATQDRLLKKLRAWQKETNAYIPTERKSTP